MVKSAGQGATMELPPANGERILVIEDDRAVQKALLRLFEAEGFAVEIAGNGTEGLEKFRAAPPAVLVLDLSLPGRPARTFVGRSARRRRRCRSLFSARALRSWTRCCCSNSGRTTMSRSRSVRGSFRRGCGRRCGVGGAAPMAETFSFAGVKVDFTKMELHREGELVPMTSQEFKVLKFMIQNAERVLTREELLNQVWGYRNYPSTRTVDNHILRLRRKLEKDSANPLHFRTVHSAGYKFVP